MILLKALKVDLMGKLLFYGTLCVRLSLSLDRLFSFSLAILNRLLLWVCSCFQGLIQRSKSKTFRIVSCLSWTVPFSRVSELSTTESFSFGRICVDLEPQECERGLSSFFLFAPSIVLRPWNFLPWNFDCQLVLLTLKFRLSIVSALKFRFSMGFRLSALKLRLSIVFLPWNFDRQILFQ